MKVSLIFILIVQATLSLARQIFVDSVNFILYPCDIKNKQTCHLFTAQRNSKVTSVVHFISGKLEKLSPQVYKVVLRTDLNVYRESYEDLYFLTNSLFMCYKWSQIMCLSCTNLIFALYKFFQSVYFLKY